MKRSTVAFDRIFTFLIGLLLLAVAVWALLDYFNVKEAETVTERAQISDWGTLAQQSWYNYLLAGVAVLGVIIGLWILLANLRRNRIGRVEARAYDRSTTYIGLNQLVDATAEALEQVPGVEQAHGYAIEDRGRQVLKITAVVEPTADELLINQAIEQAERDLRAAVPDVEFDSEFYLRVGQLN